MKATGHPYEGSATRQREKLSPGLITATFEEPRKKHRISGPHPVTSETARFIAERQLGGAIIVWRTPNKEFATVYSRVSAA